MSNETRTMAMTKRHGWVTRRLARGTGAGALVALLLVACSADEDRPSTGSACGFVSYSDVFFGSDDPPPAAAVCMPRSFAVDALGHAPCVLIEGRHDDDCACDGSRRDVQIEHTAIADELAMTSVGSAQEWNCFCEVRQLDDDALVACREERDLDGDATPGWCYVDSTVEPLLGNPELTAACPENHKRVLRAVGDAVPAADRGVMLYCEQATSC